MIALQQPIRALVPPIGPQPELLALLILLTLFVLTQALRNL